MLDEDALRFDAFLKENDEKVQEAIKKAEVGTFVLRIVPLTDCWPLQYLRVFCKSDWQKL